MPTLSDFSGGLNLRDSPAELALNETPNALNWTLDQRGAARLRSGWSNVATLPGVSGKAAFIFYSEALDQWLCARETSGAPNNMRLHTRPGDLSGSWTDRGTLGTNLAMLASFVDWPGQTPMVVLAAAGVGGGSGGGTWTWNGTTLTGVTGGLAGYGLAVWQNRVWRVGYPLNDASGNFARLEACKPGDPTLWGVANGGTTVDLRIKDASRLTGIGLAGDTLVVFKQGSAYRIFDSGTGEPHLLDGAAGCQGPLAIVPLRGRLYTWGADNLYEWDGVGPGRKVGDKARPFFATDAALIGGVPALCGGSLEDRALFAYPPTAGDDNRRWLEYDPQQRWLMKHQLASTSADAVSSFARKDGSLYAAVMDANALYKSGGVAGSDGASAYDGAGGRASNNFRTPWLQPGGGKLARLLRAQLEGLTNNGTIKLRVYKDWDGTTFDEYDVSADLNTSIIGIDALPSILRSLGHARSFAFEFFATGGTTSVSSLDLDFTPLEQ